MSKKSWMKNQTHIRDGKVVLYQREDGNPNWYYMFRWPSGKWRKLSSKTGDFKEAKEIAGNEFDRVRFLNKEGIEVEDKPILIRNVADKVVAILDKMKGQLGYKTIYYDYSLILDGPVKDLLGDIDIRKVKTSDFERYSEELPLWESKKKKPSKKLLEKPKPRSISTIQNHCSALNYLLKYAESKNYISVRPIVSKKDMLKRPQQPRPFFTQDEISKLILNSRDWMEDGKRRKPETNKTINKKISRQVRQLLYGFIGVVYLTGIRPGPETNPLKWNCISTQRHDNGIYFNLRIEGKGKSKRDVIAPREIKPYLEYLRDLHEDLRGMSFEDLFKLDRYVFITPNQTKPQRLGEYFKRLLIDYDMYNENEPKVLYCLRHSAMMRLLKNKNLTHLQIANYFGTSVKMVEDFYQHNAAQISPDDFGSGDAYRRMMEIGRNERLIEEIFK
ncbi:MAG: hypothetical protein K9L19_18645 [Desulfarculaceae bacterium]|nr:hypothetical protein [Desulfarculaceae bacterium]MCF8122680.1 hypothetical protein [Desulfarculaceae bacterium]